MRLGSKGSVCRWQVKLCDPLVTHESYLSALRWWYMTIKRYINTRYFYSEHCASVTFSSSDTIPSIILLLTDLRTEVKIAEQDRRL